MRRPIALLLACASSMLVAAPVTAQAAYIFGGGGFTVPASKFSDIADAGWMGTAGVLVPLSEGFLLGGQGFYGRNKHREVAGARTDLKGAMGLVYRTFGSPDGPTPFASLGAGYLSASFKYSGSSVDSSAFAMSGGLGIEVPLGSLRGFLSGAYTLGFGDLDNVRYVAVNAGIGFPIGGGM